MPTITISHKDLEGLLGTEISQEQLEEILLSAKAEVEEIQGDEIRVELKDANRPDLWSIEGIARQLRGDLGEVGLPKMPVSLSSVNLIVDKSLRNIRPYIACAVLKGLEMTDERIKQLVQLQEKLDLSYGRKRRRASIGVYDWSKIKQPIYYTVTHPQKEKFVPLGYQEEMTLEEILTEHPKGKEYGWILENEKRYPLLKDSADRILSLPPIINSNDSGRVTESTKEVLIEVTGTKIDVVEKVLNIVTAALMDRGAKASAVTIEYPWKVQKQSTTRITPNLAPDETKLDIKEVERILGLSLTKKQIIALIKQRRMDVKTIKEAPQLLIVKTPAYRCDIMHPRDIIEDILIAYGYNNVSPRKPEPMNYGSLTATTKYVDRIREIAIGLSLQELLTFNMTNTQTVYEKMNLPPSEECVEIANPISQRYTILRPNLLPGLMEVLSENTHVPYPQRIYECGTVTKIDKEIKQAKTTWAIAIVIADPNTDFNEIHSIVDGLLAAIKKDYHLIPKDLPYCIMGRAGEIIANDSITIGVIGEVAPQILVNWGLKVPASVAEIDLSILMELE